MKIGILTFQSAVNYGTALQAAALKKVLSEYGHDVAFLDHLNPAIDSSNAVFDIRRIADIKYTLAHLLNLSVALKRRAAFRAFQKANIPFIPDIPKETDLVVAGSDQVWNPALTGEGWEAYFLNFEKAHTKKAAYAGSFGVSHIDDCFTARMRELLEDFDYITVREDQAADIVEELTGKKVPVVLDPTLLLNGEQWSEIADKSFNKKGYIFVYTVFNDEALWNYAQNLSEKTGLPIRTISYSKIHRHNALYDYTAGPAQWLSYLKNADYVVTNSFHGVAFSINFGKNFFFNLPEEAKKVGSRLYSITKRYGLEKRNISGEISDEVSYEMYNEQLEKDRSFSRACIEKILKTTDGSGIQ